ncbi:MAG: copper resistance protein NlpE [Culturomica sp.]|jgi:hypothetical protein|nr:copper resistance protein NlpE [Culturomica sp.]
MKKFYVLIILAVIVSLAACNSKKSSNTTATNDATKTECCEKKDCNAKKACCDTTKTACCKEQKACCKDKKEGCSKEGKACCKDKKEGCTKEQKACCKDKEKGCCIKGVYKGTLPTASGEGMEVSIELGDKTYVKTVKYVGKKDVIKTEGSFKFCPKEKVLTLTGESKPNAYKVEKGQLIQLDMEGKVITGDLADKYILKK